MKKLPLTLAAMMLLTSGACKASAQVPEFDACTVQPTRLSTPADEGHPDPWVEADGESIDSDPCDEEDFEVDAMGRVTSTRKKPKFSTPGPVVTTKKPTVVKTTKKR